MSEMITKISRPGIPYHRLLLIMLLVVSLLACFFGVNAVIAAEPEVTRSMPASVNPGQTFEVSITFDSPDEASSENPFNAIGISDLVPDGWAITLKTSDCTPTPNLSKVENGTSAQYIWYGPYSAGVSFTAVYGVAVPADASGTYTFTNGQLIYYLGDVKHTVTISGQNSVTVNAPVNNAPLADNQSVYVSQNAAGAITLTGSDAETVELTFSVVTPPANGTLGAITNNPGTPGVNGVPNTDTALVTYTPDSGYTGSDSFTYRVNDGSVDSVTATVNIKVITPVTVSVDAPTYATEDTNFTANILISSVSDFNAANYTITFDPDVLNLVNVTQGGIPGSIDPPNIPVAFEETSPGTVIIVNALQKATEGISGSGSLAVLTFHVEGSDGETSQINLSNGILSDDGSFGSEALEIPASWVNDSVAVGTGIIPVTIEVSNLNHIYDGTPKYASVTTNPPEAAVIIKYYLDSELVASPINAGSYSVVVDTADPEYSGHATGTLVIAKANQTITFGELAGKTYGDAPFDVSATASSGLPVSFSVVSGPATISGNTVTITGAGTVTIEASQSGNANYNAATDAGRSFSVAKANQTITFALIGNKGYASEDFALTATASSGLPVSFAVSAGSPCEIINGNIVHITGLGTCTITATQDGNQNYNPAPPAVQTFQVLSTPGDANGDGEVNSLDITKVVRIILQLDPVTPTADANRDGEINALDITTVELIILNSTD
ncbi:MAG: MBG domain-containing protein [Dehalococcoidales bacterium]|nr:MBG domain-containing protein [Dehalococcoidales bacterium]